MTSRIWALVCLLSAASLAGCRGDANTLTPSGISTLQLQDITTSAATPDASGILNAGAPPAESNGPTITVTGNPTIINGGTMLVQVDGASPLAKLFVYIGAKAVGLASEAPGGIGGYYEIALPTTQTATTVLLTFPQEIPLREFDVRLAAANAAGAVGPSVGLPAQVTLVGTGDVQVTLSWDVNSDVDLHVIDPAGEEIYYINRQAASGGVLDLDSNAACQIDGKRNENITWPVGRAPIGKYTVRVDYWDSCGVAKTNYTVRVNAGGAPQLFTGAFTGNGDQGGAGAGRPITTFERQSARTIAFDVVPDAGGAFSKGVKAAAGGAR